MQTAATSSVTTHTPGAEVRRENAPTNHRRSIKHARRARSIRYVPWLIAGCAMLGWWGMNRWLDLRLARNDFFTGYSLAILCGVLLLLPLRKKLLLVPLGSVAAWQQAHHLIGTLAFVLFFLHAGWPIRGTLEISLAFLFLFHSVSGLVLWYLNSTTPRKLSIFGHEILASEIPAARQRVAEQARLLATQAAGRVESTALAELYMEQLCGFFVKRRSWLYLCIPNGRLRRRWLDSLKQLDRYLDHDGRRLREQMCLLVQQKDDLDFRDSLLKRLRWWRIIHSGMILLFTCLMIVHIWLAHRFHGT